MQKKTSRLTGLMSIGAVALLCACTQEDISPETPKEETREGDHSTDEQPGVAPTSGKGSNEAWLSNEMQRNQGAGIVAVENNSDGARKIYDYDGARFTVRKQDITESGSVALPSALPDDFENTSYIALAMYNATNLGGSVLLIYVPDNASGGNVNSFPAGWNDQIRSYAIKGNCSVTLYEHGIGVGRSVTASRIGIKAGYVSATSLPEASSLSVTCNDKKDARAVVYSAAAYSGTALPVWDDWNLTESGMGVWDTQVSSADINTQTGEGLRFTTVATDPRAIDMLRIFEDANLFPSEINDKIVRMWVDLIRPLQCNFPGTCYRTSTRCGTGQTEITNGPRSCWNNFRGRSFCTLMRNCMDPNTGNPIFP